jgi:thiaminase/transcriptional activator TenA
MAGFAAQLWQTGRPIQDAILGHPFVRGLGDGSLPLERYREYLRQDFVFLLDYARVLALAAAAAEEPEAMARWAGLLHATLHGEMELHRRTCAELGIDPAELEQVPPAPYTFTYTRHLRAVARDGSELEIAAGLLPCQWGYAEIAEALAARGLPPVPAYADWVRAYTSPDYRDTARWVWEVCDRLGAAAGPAERARAERAFRASLRCEYLFWDGCWRAAAWPV